MTEVEILKDAIAQAWFKDEYFTSQGYVSGVTKVATGGVVELLRTVAATAVQEHYAARLERLTHTVHKLSRWAGYDIAELIEDGDLEEGDLV